MAKRPKSAKTAGSGPVVQVTEILGRKGVYSVILAQNENLIDSYHDLIESITNSISPKKASR